MAACAAPQASRYDQPARIVRELPPRRFAPTPARVLSRAAPIRPLLTRGVRSGDEKAAKGWIRSCSLVPEHKQPMGGRIQTLTALLMLQAGTTPTAIV